MKISSVMYWRWLHLDSESTYIPHSTSTNVMMNWTIMVVKHSCSILNLIDQLFTCLIICWNHAEEIAVLYHTLEYYNVATGAIWNSSKYINHAGSKLVLTPHQRYEIASILYEAQLQLLLYNPLHIIQEATLLSQFEAMSYMCVTEL